MSGLDFLFSPNSQVYNAGQQMESDFLKNQYQRATNANTEATLPGIQGQSMSHLAKGQIDTAGVQDNIALNHEEAFTKMGDNQLKQVAQLGERLGQMGGALSQLPPMLQQQKFKELAPQFGLDVNNPAVRALSSLPPDQFVPALQGVATSMASMTQKAIQDRQKQQQVNEGHVEVAKLNNDARVTSAETRGQAGIQQAMIAADARIKAAEISANRAMQIAEKKAASMLGGMDEKKRWTYLNSLDPSEMTEVEKGEFARLTRMRLEVQSVGKPDTGPQILNGGAPTTPGQRVEKAVSDLTQPKPAQSQEAPQVSSLSQLKQMYPGKSDAELKAAYKRKYGKDIN